MEVNGTLLWYYNICKREVWLMSHNIIPDQHDENIDLGRFIHEYSYQRKDKEISFGNVKFDVLLENKKEILIGETKKSSKFSDASKWQLLYYIKTLRTAGINAKGMLLYPEERKRVSVELSEENEEKLNDMIKDIESICSEDFPPQVSKIGYCKNCGYREYCYA